MTREEEILQSWREKQRICVGIEAIHQKSYLLGAQWADEHQKNPWVSVEDRLPEMTEESQKYKESPSVFVYFDNHVIGVAYYSYSYERWESDGARIPSPIYWMYMPTLPKGDKQ